MKSGPETYGIDYFVSGSYCKAISPLYLKAALMALHSGLASAMASLCDLWCCPL